ncbi:Formin-like protein 14 [Auxenochlorella protothecoides]|uniref:Formin-like protein n=1 Tax=Auxenochlorella protothecoides TaxID=3075 RepID=A0A087SBV7_AUXPR|nr:Formin-like protein 14 [Auxenochlorella protothecoides]KFM23211.1 Formin-like protein 14 [Auxenochlorella protothecoides]
MDLSPFSWLSKGLWFGGPSQEARPYYLTDRLLACVYEEDRESWNRSSRLSYLSDGYKQYLRELSVQLKGIRERGGEAGPGVKDPAGIQFVNLSPAWRDPDVYSYFNNSVMEFPLNIWERPPGLGLCPLHILVTICSQMHQWLSLSPDNLVVLHARTCTGTERHLATFLAACHLIFSAGLDNVRLALDSLPPLGGRPRASKSLFDGNQENGFRTAAALNALLPSQQRFGGYLAALLHAPHTLPPNSARPLLLKGILASRLGCLDPAGGGRAVWTQGASLDVLSGQDDTLSFDVGLVVQGDVTLALWFADHVGEWEPPAAAYSFHTAFVEAGVVRVTGLKLDLPGVGPGAAALAEAEGFFMDIMLDDDIVRMAEGEAGDLHTDVERLRGSWEALIDQTDGFLGFRPVPESGMDDVMSQIRAVQSARLRPSQIPRTLFREAGAVSAASSASSSPTAARLRRVGQSLLGPAASSSAASLAGSEEGGVAGGEAPPGRGAAIQRGSPGGPGALGTPTPPALPRRKGSGVPPPPTPPSTPAVGAKKLRAFYWDTMRRKPGSVWEELGEAQPLEPVARNTLEQLFEVHPTVPARGRAGGAGSIGRGPKATGPVVKVLPLTRANNVSIMLTQFSTFPGFESIRTALLTGSGALGLDHLSLLMQIVPSDDEAKALRAYPGPAEELSPPEKFMLVMSDVPRVIAKARSAGFLMCSAVIVGHAGAACTVGALMFRLQFRSLCEDAAAGMAAVRLATEQLRASRRLRKVLAAVLAAGNALNSGTARGGAAALKLESLLKLADVKASEGLLDFVAWSVYRGEGAEVRAATQYLASELGALSEAVRRMQSDVQEALRALQGGLASARKEHATEVAEECAAEANASPADFAAVLGAFLAQAEAQLAELSEASAATEQEARRTLEWLGAGVNQDAASVFELLHRHVTAFDAAYATVHRLATQKR